MQGGGNREDLRPMSPGERQHRLGSHKGSNAALNVTNPQPGMKYYWERDERGRINLREDQGWTVVTVDSPERKGPETDPNRGQQLDTSVRRSDVVLMKIPLSKYQEIKEFERKSREGGDSATEAFMAKGEPFNQRYGGGRQVYYKTGGHSTRKE